MPTTRWIILAAATCGILVLGVWVALRNHTNSSATRIAAILPLTGPGASFGESSRNALLLAADEINGTANKGPRIDLVIEDGMTDPKSSVTAFNRLYDTKGIRHFITTVSSVSLALAPLADQKKSLLFANASHPLVTDNHQFVLRYSNTAPDEARVLVDFVAQHSPVWHRVYVIAVNDDYGRAYAQELSTRIGGHPEISIVGTEFYDRAATDFRTVTTKALSGTPDVVLLVGFGRSMGLCLRQLREIGYAGPFVASLGFVLTPDAVTAADEAVRGGYVLNFSFVSEAGARAFRDKYRARYGADPTPNAVIDYGTLHLLADGIRAVGNDPALLSSHIRALQQTHLPTGDVTISPQGDILAPVSVAAVPSTGTISLWGD